MTEKAFHLPPERVGVAIKPSSVAAANLARRVLAELARRGVEGVVDADSAAVLGLRPGPPRALLGRESDVVLVLGGDGTFLSVARGCPTSTPVAGINLGTLGFLTEHAPDSTFDLLEKILVGDIQVQERARLLVDVMSERWEHKLLVLNDVVINKAALARIVTLKVAVDGEFLSRYRGDGLILATPTGSTGYNLSAGGPIVDPRLEALLITPICSHTLTAHPLAIPLGSTVEAWLEEGDAEVYVTLDGQLGFSLNPEVRVKAQPASQPLSLVRDPASSFFSILHHKLKWGEREG